MKNFNPEIHEKTERGYRIKQTLSSVKQSKILQIKQQAAERITALNWQVERASRHEKLGKAGKKGMNAALQKQQDIEEASDQAELDVLALSTIEEVKNFAW